MKWGQQDLGWSPGETGRNGRVTFSPVGGGAEVLDPGVEFAGFEGFEAAGGEGFAGEGGEHGAVDDGLPEGGKIVRRVALGGEVTGHSAEEGVARAGGIGDGIEGVGGTAEDFRVRSGEWGVRSGEWGVRSGEWGVGSGECGVWSGR